MADFQFRENGSFNWLWGNLRDEVYSNNSHTLDELKQIIRETITSLEISELKVVSILSEDLKCV
jgi:hypothetical protein